MICTNCNQSANRRIGKSDAGGAIYWCSYCGAWWKFGVRGEDDHGDSPSGGHFGHDVEVEQLRRELATYRAHCEAMDTIWRTMRSWQEKTKSPG